MVGETAPVLPADRPRYLMGVGTPADLLGGGRRAASICSIASCRRATAAMAWRSPVSARSTSRMRSTPTIRGRSTPKAAVRPRAISRAPTCITFSRLAKRSAVRFCRSLICSTTRT